MDISVIKTSILRAELQKFVHEGFLNVVKAVVDVEQGVMAIGGELHADEEVVLIDQHGSKRENTWGINFYLDRTGDSWIEFDSMVNIKPNCGNRSRVVESEDIRNKIRVVVKKLIVG